MDIESFINELSSQVTASNNIQSFVFGDLSDINAKHNHTYPLLMVTPPDSTIPNLRKNEQIYDMNIYLFTTLHKSSSDTKQGVWSDLSSYLYEYVDKLYDNASITIPEEEEIRVERASGQHNDDLIGVKFVMKLTLKKCHYPISKPTALTATAAGGGQIDLAWVDNANNETNYEVYRSTDMVSYTLLTTLASDSNSYSDTSLSVGAAYFYKVRAINTTNNKTSNYSNVDFKVAT